ncbi:MAG: hypothetical protein EB141_16450, partial [Verrucomicrobia bacterium]|nr:hypothetical protein [Verrucomicrobiota bacterium]
MHPGGIPFRVKLGEAFRDCDEIRRGVGEHERAKARLAAFKAQLVAKGEKLAIADHVPKLPPALSNAAPDFITVAKRLPEFN